MVNTYLVQCSLQWLVLGFIHRLFHREVCIMTFSPANNNDNSASSEWGQSDKLLEWLSRFSRTGLSFAGLNQAFDNSHKSSIDIGPSAGLADDWQTVTNLSGYSINDYASAGAGLPLTAAEIDHFRRNHRGTESRISRDFLTARSDLPSPLSELYGLYLHRCRVDAEAALFVAQATGSTRVARVMADLLAVGAFANALEYIGHLGTTYSVPAAFDTSDIIDFANHEAARRLALAPDHPSHLLRLTPDEIAVLASNIAEKRAVDAASFLRKAQSLAEARQDVTRLPISQQFATAIIEGDVPLDEAWGQRLSAAYARILEGWVIDLPEIEAVVH